MLASITANTLATALSLALGNGPTPLPAVEASQTSTHAALIDQIAQHRQRQEWLPALALIAQGLAANPEDPTLYRLQALTLADHGNLFRAWSVYEKKPHLFSEAEANRLQTARLGRMVSWSQLPGPDEDRDLDEAKAAIQQIDAALSAPGLDPASRQRTRIDRLILLDRLRRFDELIREYTALQSEGVEIPGYVLPTVANAYLSTKQPEQAEILYRSAMEHKPEDHELVIQHAYALVEAERFSPAISSMWRMRESQPAWHNEPGSRVYQENWKRLDAEMAYFMFRSFAEDLPASLEAFSGMVEIAPMNGGAQEATGSVLLRRGRNEQALERFQMAETINPRDFQSRIGQAEALMSLQRFDLARPIHEQLRSQRAGNLHVEALSDRYKNRTGWQFGLHAGSGRNRTGAGTLVSPQGTREGEYGIDIASPLLAYRWRLTAFNTVRWADYAGSRIHDRRLGIGARYAFDRLNADLQISRANDGFAGTAAELNAQWRINDDFDLRGGIARHDPGVSLQARAAGVHADSHMLGISWAPNERRNAALDLSEWRFSDGNRRKALQVSASQRLFTRAHWLIDGYGGYYTSHNSLANAAYFNPSRDQSTSLGLRINHLAWRRYERTFRHILNVQASHYRQQGFDSAWTPSLSYRHEWQPNASLWLGYGVSWARPVYNGNRETHTGFDFQLSWVY